MTAKEIEFKNKCGCSVDCELLNQAIVWYGDDKQHSKKSIYLYGNYPAVSVRNEKIHVHRLLMMYQVKQRLAKSVYVHHKDENKLNAQIENLAAQSASEHQRAHATGRKKSEETKKKISETLKKRFEVNNEKSARV